MGAARSETRGMQGLVHVHAIHGPRRDHRRGTLLQGLRGPPLGHDSTTVSSSSPSSRRCRCRSCYPFFQKKEGGWREKSNRMECPFRPAGAHLKNRMDYHDRAEPSPRPPSLRPARVANPEKPCFDVHLAGAHRVHGVRPRRDDVLAFNDPDRRGPCPGIHLDAGLPAAALLQVRARDARCRAKDPRGSVAGRGRTAAPDRKQDIGASIWKSPSELLILIQ